MAKFCTNCGAELKSEALFCTRCGTKCADPAPQSAPAPAQTPAPAATPAAAPAQAQPKLVDRFVNTINDMTGEQGAAEIHLKELFSQTFKKHTRAEQEELFICGTAATTPAEKDMLSEWPKPWLFARVFLALAVVFAGLYVMVWNFSNIKALPGFIFIGAMMVPFALVVFFWEVNVPRNISILDCVGIFFVGGVLSVVTTSIVYDFLGRLASLSYIGAIFIGLAEELGKAVIVVWYVRRKNCKYILNGLLIGACVGAGFAVFETAGYALELGLDDNSLFTVQRVLFIRGLLALGGHIVWTAMVGAALTAVKGEQPFSFQMLKEKHFLQFFALAVALHAVWDMPIPLGQRFYLIQWILSVIGVAVVLVVISAGLRQVVRYANAARAAAAAEAAAVEPEPVSVAVEAAPASEE